MEKPKGLMTQEASHKAELLWAKGLVVVVTSPYPESGRDKIEKQVQQTKSGIKTGMGITLVDPGKGP